jgi:hypothetical protein
MPSNGAVLRYSLLCEERFKSCFCFEVNLKLTESKGIKEEKLFNGSSCLAGRNFEASQTETSNYE